MIKLIYIIMQLTQRALKRIAKKETTKMPYKRIITSITLAVLILNTYPPSYAEDSSHKTKHEHNEHKADSSKNIEINSSKILTAKDVSIFLNTFIPIEKELNNLKSSLFEDSETFSKHIKDSNVIKGILKKEGVSVNDYMAIYNSVTDAYNEIKMTRFETLIKENKHEKFLPDENLKLKHNAEEHQALHEMQEEKFSEKYPAELLGAKPSEPGENIKLIEKYEDKLDKLFNG